MYDQCGSRDDRERHCADGCRCHPRRLRRLRHGRRLPSARATGRSVIAYMSQVHDDPDLAVELFVLEPGPEHLVAQGEEHLTDGQVG